MDRGYLKLWRMSIDSDVFANESLWRLFSWCLMKTTYKERFVPLKIGKGETIVRLKPGQFIFGRNKAAKSLSWSASTVWQRMKRLELLECIEIRSNNQYSTITICNWEKYQADDNKNVTTNGQPSDNQRTTNGQPNDTNNKVVEGVEGVEVKGKKFKPPSLEEVSQYCAERGNSVDAEKWHNHYTAKGWMIGKNKMKDWKAAVRTWEGNSKKDSQTFAQRKDTNRKQAINDFVNE